MQGAVHNGADTAECPRLWQVSAARGVMQAATIWICSLFLLKSHFTNTPGLGMCTQLKITWTECKPKSDHLAAANAVISCFFLPSHLSPPPQFKESTGVFLYTSSGKMKQTLFSWTSGGLITCADLLVDQSRAMLMPCRCFPSKAQQPQRELVRWATGDGCPTWTSKEQIFVVNRGRRRYYAGQSQM